MKALFGVVGLLVVLAIVGLVVRQQLWSPPSGRPAMPASGAATGAAAPPAATPAQQVEQVRQSVEGVLQQPRPMADEK